MSRDSIDYGVRVEQHVVKWHRIQCDDQPSGYVEVAKTAPNGANAMTVTINPMYGEPFTVNADVLKAAIDMALEAPSRSFRHAYEDEANRRRRVDALEPGDRIAVDLRGRSDWRRKATVERVDDYYVHVAVDQHPTEVEEGCPQQRLKIPCHDVAVVYDRAEA